MKKNVWVILASAMLGVMLVSCAEKSVKVETKTDTLSYSAGMMIAISQDVRSYLLERENMDSACVQDLVRGLRDGFQVDGDKEKAYAIGFQIGSQLKTAALPQLSSELFSDSTSALSPEIMLAAYEEVVRGKSSLFSEAAADSMLRVQMDATRSLKLEQEFGENKAAGIAFLEANKGMAGVKVTPSGLQYKVLKEGTGKQVEAGNTVKVAYKGTLIDGTVFDESKTGVKLNTNNCIQGWQEALPLMKVGSKYMLYIPYELAYGMNGTRGIDPFSALVFEVEVLGVE